MGNGLGGEAGGGGEERRRNRRSRRRAQFKGKFKVKQEMKCRQSGEGGTEKEAVSRGNANKRKATESCNKQR